LRAGMMGAIETPTGMPASCSWRMASSLYERKLAALEALKKSLLHQAFAGEL
jgi:hypothetical protein